MIRNVQAIVLWSRRSRDADKVVGLYTDTLGRVTARATSAARSTAKFGGLTEPFVLSDVALYLMPDQRWGKIVGGQIQRAFPALRVNLERCTAASWICEVVHRLTPEEQPSPEKFALLAEALEALETVTHYSALRLGFALRFLQFAGFGLDNCLPWQEMQAQYPERAEALMNGTLLSLGEERWTDPVVLALEALAGGVVTNQLNKPLSVNRFRQMTGITI